MIFTSGFDSTFYRGAVVYGSKTQPLNALSPTEAYLIATVNVVKTARFLSYALQEPGFLHDCPIPIYKDNDTTIDIVNSIITTERTRRIDVQLFNIQGYNSSGDIIMNNTPVIINPEDDLTKP